MENQKSNSRFLRNDDKKGQQKMMTKVATKSDNEGACGAII